MKMTKRILATATAALTVTAALAGCTGGTSSTTSKAAPSQADANKVYNIGICQLVQHEALDAATKGFKDTLTEKLGADKVKFDEQNAQGDSATCATITNGFVSSGVDLIMANATPALQAAASATSEIPILGTSVTEYGVALGLTDFDGTVGGNISGTSDLAPLDQQVAMLQELFPNAKKVGMLFCSSEPNSKYQVDEVTKLLSNAGITCTEFAFTDSNDVSSVTQKACDASDVLFIPTDNTAASNTEAIANVVLASNTPVIAGESGLCKGCGVATLSIDYYELGKITGQMAAKILTGEADVSTMPIQFAPSVTKQANMANCQKLNITLPSDYTALATE